MKSILFLTTILFVNGSFAVDLPKTYMNSALEQCGKIIETTLSSTIPTRFSSSRYLEQDIWSIVLGNEIPIQDDSDKEKLREEFASFLKDYEKVGVRATQRSTVSIFAIRFKPYEMPISFKRQFTAYYEKDYLQYNLESISVTNIDPIKTHIDIEGWNTFRKKYRIELSKLFDSDFDDNEISVLARYAFNRDNPLDEDPIFLSAFDKTVSMVAQGHIVYTYKDQVENSEKIINFKYDIFNFPYISYDSANEEVLANVSLNYKKFNKGLDIVTVLDQEQKTIKKTRLVFPAVAINKYINCIKEKGIPTKLLTK